MVNSISNIEKNLRKIKVKELKDLLKEYDSKIRVNKLKKKDLIKKIIEVLLIVDNEILIKPHPKLSGSGIFDYFRRLFNPYMYNRNSTNILNKYGDNKIMVLQINRTPIFDSINKALNLISIGKWNELREKYNYDTMFHLSIVATILTNEGKYIRILVEKNEQINISENVKIYPTTEMEIIEASVKNLNLKTMLNNTLQKIGKEDFFIYSAFNNNCQKFIKNILISNDLYNSKLDKFVYQNIVDLVDELPAYVPRTANSITNLASWLKRLTGASMVIK